MIAYWISVLGLAAGAGMGAYGLINPNWASRLVRLREDRPGGFAEFRGTYGGLFLATHGLALFFALAVSNCIPVKQSEMDLFDAIYVGAWMSSGYMCGAIWIGTAVGRLLSMLLDKSKTNFNVGSAIFEVVLGLAVSASAWTTKFSI